jgi:hypothetical protein
MGIQGKFTIPGINKDDRYIGNINGTIMVHYDLCESKTNADQGLSIKRLSYSIQITDEMKKLCYEELKKQFEKDDIVDVLEDNNG